MTLQSTRTRTRRALVGAGAALAAAALAVGAGAGLDRSNQRGVVKVAVIEVVKGHFAPQNRLVANGAEIAVQQINAKGGIGGKVEIDLTRHRIAPSASPVATVLRLSRQGVRTLILPCNVDLQPQIADEAPHPGNAREIELVAHRQRAKPDAVRCGPLFHRLSGARDDRYVMAMFAEPRGRLEHLVDRTGGELVELENLENAHGARS